MSGICGMLRRDDRPTNNEYLHAMMKCLRRRGPDREGVWTGQSLALGNQLLFTTPESKHEILPLVDSESDIVLGMDGRIDNRQDLQQQLGLSSHEVKEMADSEIVLSAYKKWGEDSPSYLVGDYAFAVWDRRMRILFCVRDHLGARPFYYYHSGNVFVFASEIKALFVVPEVPRKIFDPAVADFLQRIAPNTSQTFYQGILRLEPGTTLSISADKIRKRSYWKPDPTRRLPKATSDQYAEHFLEIFTESVRCRLRSAYPVGCQLSGGLDSSSVACVARKILSERGELLQTFSAIFPGLPKSDLVKIDERRFQQAVIDQGGIIHHPYRADLLQPLARLADHLDLMDEPFFGPNLYLGDEAHRQANERGIRVMLDGLDGDTIVSHGYERLNSLFFWGNWCRLYWELTKIAEHFGESREKILKAFIFRPYFREPLAHLYRLVRSVVTPGWNFQEIIDTTFGKKCGLHRRTTPRLDTFKSPARLHAQYLASPLQTTALEMVSRFSTPFQVETRSPFFDRRLMEFCLALPSEEKLRNGWGRFVLRQSMEGVLPNIVQWRTDKSNLTYGFSRGLLRFHHNELKRMVHSPHSSMAKVVRQEVLENELGEFAVDPIARPRNALNLYCAYVFYSWLNGCGGK